MRQGFTLIELMIVVAIITFLSVLSVPRLMKMVAKAKRSEAYLYLRSVAQAQKVYYAEHGRYAPSFKELGWQPEGIFNYTYGVPGSENNFIGALDTSTSHLRGSLDTSKFTVSAAGSIYGDKIDVLTIDHKGTIKLVKDALG